MRLAVGWASRAFDGAEVCGDAVVVRERGALTLLGVIDALGHGPHAADAAEKAVAWIDAAPSDRFADLPSLFAGIDEALRSTRGAAATLCLFDGTTLRYAGVGNVALRAASGRLPMVLAAGILGRRPGPVRGYQSEPAPGLRFALFSDGIVPLFSLDETRALPPAEASSRIVAAAGRSNDDATILIADVVP